jgi:predicted Zn-dependent protease
MPMGELEEVQNKIKGYTARMGCDPHFDVENGQVKGITLRMNTPESSIQYVINLCKANDWRAFDMSSNDKPIDFD